MGRRKERRKGGRERGKEREGEREGGRERLAKRGQTKLRQAKIKEISKHTSNISHQ